MPRNALRTTVVRIVGNASRASTPRFDRGKRCPGRRDMMILVPGTSWARVLYSIHGQKSPAGDRIDPNAECTEVKRTESYKMRCRTRPGVPLSPRYDYFSHIFRHFSSIFRIVSTFGVAHGHHGHQYGAQSTQLANTHLQTRLQNTTEAHTALCTKIWGRAWTP